MTITKTSFPTFNTFSNLSLNFGKTLVDYYKNLDIEKDYTLKQVEQLANTIISNETFIPIEAQTKKTQAGETSFKRKAYSIGQSAKSLLSDALQEYKKTDLIWNTYCRNVSPNEKVFKETSDKLFCKLTQKDRDFFIAYIWTAVRKLKGLKVRTPIFLGLYGGMGDGKDATLEQMQKAFGVDAKQAEHEDDMTIINDNFQTWEFYTRGIVRFSEISARKSADIATFKRLITCSQVTLNQKNKDMITMESRNVYCGTANEHFSVLTNENQNRRIAEITWQSLIGVYTLEEIYEMFVTLVNSCPYDNENFLDNQLFRVALNTQESAGIGCKDKDDLLTMSTTTTFNSTETYLDRIIRYAFSDDGGIRVENLRKEMKECFKRDISRGEVSRFLSQSEFFTRKSPTSKIFVINVDKINDLIRNTEYESETNYKSFINWTVPTNEPPKKENEMTEDQFYTEVAWESEEGCEKDGNSIGLVKGKDFFIEKENDYFIAKKVTRRIISEEKTTPHSFNYNPMKFKMPICENKYSTPSFDNSGNNEFVVSAEYTEDFMKSGNPIDRKGENMRPTCFVFESDDLSIDEQKQNLQKILNGKYKDSVLWATTSGHKSIHTLVLIPAEYRDTVKEDFKFYWSKVGEMIYGSTEHLDNACASVARLTRCPNAIRADGSKQECLYVNENAKGIDLADLVKEHKVIENEKAFSDSILSNIRSNTTYTEQSEETKLKNFYNKNPDKWQLAYNTLICGQSIPSGSDLFGTLRLLLTAQFTDLAVEFGRRASKEHPTNISLRTVNKMLKN